jgi:hypothetical protein
MVVDGVREHIHNGGVSFEVTNANGPTIKISADHFGNVTNQINLHVTRQSLLNLAAMFTEAAQAEYDEPYCCASESHVVDKETGKYKQGEWTEEEKEQIIQLMSNAEGKEIVRTENGIKTADGYKSWPWNGLYNDFNKVGSLVNGAL